MSLASGHTEELLRRALLEYARGQHHESDGREVGSPVMASPMAAISHSQGGQATLASIGASAAKVAVH